jgi:hypothetical protein
MPKPSKIGPDRSKPNTKPEPDWAAGSVVDRRIGIDRRDIAERMGKRKADHAMEDGSTGLERRRGPGRRRTDFTKSAEEGEMTAEQFMFVLAIEAFKRGNAKMFPTWTDVLEVIRKLGYRKTMPSELSLRGVEDWSEAHDTPSGTHAKPGHDEEEWRREAA